MIPISKQTRTHYNESTKYWICHNSAQQFFNDDPQWQKVADHDQITSLYIGAAHDLCNRLRRVNFEIPVFL